jgi:hypothetical protein
LNSITVKIRVNCQFFRAYPEAFNWNDICFTMMWLTSLFGLSIVVSGFSDGRICQPGISKYPQPIGGIRMLTALLTGLGTALSDILSTVGATLGGLL